MSTDWFEVAKRVTDVRPPEPEPMRWWQLLGLYLAISLGCAAFWAGVFWALKWAVA